MKYYLSILAAITVILASCGQQAGSTASSDQAGTPDGAKLFSGYCTSCHALAKDATGPALLGVIQRWNYDTVKLAAFIKDPSKTIAAEGAGSYAGKLYDKWNHISMPPFQALSDAEMKALIKYINDGGGSKF